MLSITDRAADYARRVRRELVERGLRATEDVRNEKIGAKIREAELGRVPAMLVVGDREAASGQVAVRLHGRGDVGSVDVNEFVARARGWVTERSLESTWPTSEPSPRRAGSRS